MELISKEMPADYDLYDTADWHIGVANCNEDAILEMVDEIASKKKRYVILKGDLIDCIPITDKRFALTSFEDCKVSRIQDQANRLLEILRPIKDRILFIQHGNHEFKLINTFDLVKYWCDHLGVQWGGVEAKFIHLKKGKVKWKGFYAHGNGSIGSVAKDPIQALANQKALLKRKLQDLTSDCVYLSMGHTHKLLLVGPTIQDRLHMIDDGEKLKQTYRVNVKQNAEHIDPEARWYACNGSFLGTMSQPGKGLIAYSEIAMYAPVEQGYLKQKIRGHKLVDVKRVVV